MKANNRPPESGEDSNKGWEAYIKGDQQAAEELFPAPKGGIPERVDVKEPLVVEVKKKKGQRIVEQTQERLNKFKQDLFTRNWRKAETETGPTQLRIEERNLTGNYVKFRDLTDGHVIGMLSRKDGPVRIAADPDDSSSPLRFRVAGEVFIKVYDKNNRPGFIAEQFLMTHEEKIARLAKAPEGERHLTMGAVKLRETVLYRIKGLPTAMQDAMYKKWDDQYQQLRKKGLPENVFYAEANKIYQSVFGREYNIFADRARMEIALAIESTKIIHAGKEKSPEKRFNAALAQLGWEIGAYFSGEFEKFHAWSAKEIRDAFGLKDIPENWGGPDSTVTFNYQLGELIFSSPEKMVYIKRGPVIRELIAKADIQEQKIKERRRIMSGRETQDALAEAVGYKTPARGTRSEAMAVPEYRESVDSSAEFVDYTVKENESIIQIINKFYGRALDDVDLARELVGGQENLGKVKTGQVLRLPKTLLGRERRIQTDLMPKYVAEKQPAAPQENEPEEPPDLSEKNPYL